MSLRFRLRTAMLLVGVAAFGGAGVRYAIVLRERSREYARDATVHDIGFKINLYEAEVTSDRDKIPLLRDLSQWHAKRRDLYKRAAARPWIKVPDEPEPTSLVRYLEAKYARARAAGRERGREDTLDEELDALTLSFHKTKVSPEAFARLQEQLRAASRTGAGIDRRAAGRR